MRRSSTLLLSLFLLLLGGCSSVPETIRKPPAGAPSLTMVRQNPALHKGAEVRWGGTIAEVQNLQDETRITLVARVLTGDGEPRDLDSSEGRFIAIFDRFLDPAIYAVNRSLTVTGMVTGVIEAPLGEMQYRYPLVKVENQFLWAIPTPRCEQCDPFYDPWYPWSPHYYPWRRYPYYY